MRLRYKKKPNQYIIAVQLDLEAEGLTYQKWGAEQYAKSGDWLVKNGNDTYTIDQETFKKTYRRISDSKYVKTTSIWAEVVIKDGSVKTKEGKSYYKAGDYLVSNNKDGSDSYCISADNFNEMYEVV